MLEALFCLLMKMAFWQHIHRFLPLMAIAIMAVIVFLPAISGDILAWDDAEIISSNYRIRYLSLDTLLDVFRPVSRYGKPPFALYVPLTELSIALEYQLVGESGWLYHVTNVLLHAVNSILAALFVWRLFGGRTTALITGTLFAVHPLHVESVAWISERKDVLCAFFCLLAVLAHLRWQKHRCWRQYVAVQTFGVLALLAKPLAITLPVVLLLCDGYKGLLQRPNDPRLATHEGRGAGTKHTALRWAWLVLEKVPLSVVALGIALINAHVQHAHGALAPQHVRNVLVNILMACHGVCLYVVKTILPVRLSPVYPQPEEIYLTDGITLAAIAVTIVVVSVAVFGWRRARRVTCALTFFCVTLLPNSQLVPTGLNIYAADRFYYLPGMGLLYLLARAVRHGLRLRRWRIVVLIAFSAYVVWLGVRTFKYAQIWRSDESLWSYTLKYLPGYHIGNVNLAAYYQKEGRREEAIALYQNILSTRFDGIAMANLAMEHYKLGNVTSAYEYAQKALQGRPDMYQGLFVRAAALWALGDVTNAIRDLQRVTEIEPLFAEAYAHLTRLQYQCGNTNGAIAALERYVQLEKDDAVAALQLGRVLEETGELQRAREVYRRVARQTHNHFAWHRYGLLSLRLGHVREALRAFTMATRIAPEYAHGWTGLALAQRELGQWEEAQSLSAYATQLAPYSGVVWYDRSCILATAGQTNEALAALEKCLALDNRLGEHAARDPDFAGLRGDARFQALLREAAEGGR